MISIAICDDERMFAESVEQLLCRTASGQGIPISCEVFYDGSDLIGAVTEQGMCFDLVYLDIEMAGLDGIRTALALRETGLPALIVYMSGHEEYLKELFETEPFRFLSKPLEEDRFRAVFRSACERVSRRTGYFTFSYRKVRYRLPFSRIACFESSGRVVTVCLAGQDAGKADAPQNRFYGKINDVEKQAASMNGRFLRVHQSFLVNFDYIKAMSATEVEMLDGRRIQVSEDRRKDAMARFGALSDAEGG